MKMLLAIALVLPAGMCATPMVTGCVTREQVEELRRQEPPKVADRLTGRADEDIRPIAGSNIRLRAWGHNMLDVLKVCAS